MVMNTVSSSLSTSKRAPMKSIASANLALLSLVVPSLSIAAVS